VTPEARIMISAAQRMKLVAESVTPEVELTSYNLNWFFTYLPKFG
jgi:hypothetical protein